MNYVSSKEASKILKVHPNTLRTWAKTGKIDFIRVESGQRKYNINSLVNTERKNICYCRGSSNKQKEDLERQAIYLSEKYPNYELIKDVGSGINFQRKGLQTILEYSMSRIIGEVVIAYKDRLCRIAYEAIEFIINKGGGKIMVLNDPLEISREQELAEDLLSIVHVFSNREYGRRKYKNKKNKDLPNPIPETNA